jgi:transcription termination/antitermination protein NusA
MTQEIVDAVKALEQEKGIASDTLMDALEDALLSAYKKTPGAAKYATVELDHASADFRVYELKVPEDLEQRLLDEQFEAQIVAAEEAEARGEEIDRDLLPKSQVDPETGERREPAEPELEPERLAPFLGDIKRSDVTPDNFGRIAAQTAKQVILQRIREAERGMMYEEYKDRVGELITGIIQQSDNRYTLVQLRERVEALLPRSEQVYNERYDHGMRVKAVITDVSACSRWRFPRSPTAWWRSPAWPASPAGARRSPSSPTPTESIRWAPASARAARASGWWSPSCAARRSTSFPTTRSPPASSPRRSRRRGCARCSSTTRPRRRP